MRLVPLACGIALATACSISFAQTQAATTDKSSAPAPGARKYSTSTTQFGTLLADPAARAVLEKDIPDFEAKAQKMEQASGMTLKELQAALAPYAPDMFSDKVLADIDRDLALLPARN